MSDDNARPSDSSRQPYRRPAPRKRAGGGSGPAPEMGPLPMSGPPRREDPQPVQPASQDPAGGGAYPPYPAAMPQPVYGGYAQPPAAPPPVMAMDQEDEFDDEFDEEPSSISPVVLAALAVTGCLVLAAVGLLTAYMLKGESNRETVAATNENRVIDNEPVLPDVLQLRDEQRARTRAAIVERDDFGPAELPKLDADRLVGGRTDSAAVDAAEAALFAIPDAREAKPASDPRTPTDIASPRSDPFTDLPERVNLVATGVTGPVALGTVRLSATDEVGFELSGGDAASDDGQFQVSPVDDDRAADIELSGDGQITPVARLSIAEEKLNFAWLPEASATSADYLRNCRLQVVSGDFSQTLALRTPTSATPLNMDVAKAVNEVELPLVSVPRSATLAAEIIEVSGDVGQYSLQGPQQITGHEKVTIQFQGAAGEPLMQVQVTFEVERGRKATLAAKPFWPNGRKFDSRAVQQQLSLLNGQKQAAELKYRSLSGQARNLAQPQYEHAVATLDAQIADWERLNQICQRLRDAASIQYRVFMTLDGDSTDLFVTTGDAAPKADSRQPSPTGKRGDL